MREKGDMPQDKAEGIYTFFELKRVQLENMVEYADSLWLIRRLEADIDTQTKNLENERVALTALETELNSITRYVQLNASI